jgi:hypothetical protein
MIKYAGLEPAKIPPVNREEGPPALTNKKQENFDQIHVESSGVGLTFSARKIKNVIFFCRGKHLIF